MIATLGLTPLTLVFFQQVSLVGFLANLVAIPLVTLVVTPLALLGIVRARRSGDRRRDRAGAGRLLARLAAIPGRGLDGAGRAALGADRGPRRAPRCWCCRCRGAPAAGAAAGARAAAAAARASGRGRLRAVAADVGQGTAVLVRTRHHVLLFDTGPQYSRDSDAGQRVLVPLLRGRGDGQSTCSCSATATATTSAARASLLGALAVDALSSSLEDDHPLLAAAPRRQRCERRPALDLGRRRFRRPPPLRRRLRPQPSKSNAMSCVVHVSGPRRAACCSRATSSASRRRRWSRRRATRCAATSWWFRTTAARRRRARRSSLPSAALAVFQAGYRNRFGHPAAEVLDRYRERGIARRQRALRRLAMAQPTTRPAAVASAMPNAATGITRGWRSILEVYACGLRGADFATLTAGGST